MSGRSIEHLVNSWLALDKVDRNIRALLSLYSDDLEPLNTG